MFPPFQTANWKKEESQAQPPPQKLETPPPSPSILMKSEKEHRELLTTFLKDAEDGISTSSAEQIDGADDDDASLSPSLSPSGLTDSGGT